MGFSFKVDEYKRLIRELEHTRGIDKLIEALELIPDIIRASVREELAEVKSELDKVSGEVRDLRRLVEELADSYNELDRRHAELNRKISHMDMTVSASAEALLSRIVVDELESSGYRVESKVRNYRVDNEDIDLLVIAVKDGKEEHFLVEVKIKPSHSDVGALLSKAELYEARTGMEPKPVLAGVWVGREVEAYAASKGVVVFRL
ncbi:MAG: hypothetical protein GSR78_03030 [Desulfurococcales archaeon]|nr:hypothetical protein [Desulfurococcales archaeon]